MMVRTARGIPTGVWALGFVSLFMDVSSEMIHSLLPVFLVVGLGASASAVGLIEGVAEGAAAVTKVFSGAISDLLGRRKLLTLVGYGLAALTKPLFPLAASVTWVFAARFIDRVGKGIRGAPRDALVGDLAPPDLRGACYGLRQSLDTVGAFAGPLLAIVLMAAFADDMRAVFWVAVAPAFVSVAILAFGVHEPVPGGRRESARTAIRWRDISGIGAGYWAVIGVGAAFTLARFSEAFLVLRAQGQGLALAWVPLVLVIMNVVYAASAYPAGAFSDRLGRRGLLAGGMAVLAGADALLAWAPTVPWVLVGVAVWGLHMGLTQGLLAAVLADVARAELRGTAFGVFNLVTGLATVGASVVAGALWDTLGPAATFAGGAGFALLAMAGAAALPRAAGGGPAPARSA